ncbi:T9SS C-terminal target domain-containing protein [Aquimarina sp. AD10]|uniref:BNR-4 repeat-containing protein n=1 Tax=Aquimarina sp. AD10 TaxID=1714849 RepID=UPI000E488AAC|nr:BNR-4 repeat-containing protein [Aquimarina sp. AD10]AXT60558.1 T9SS C-terminal target domain-containing protein [Aquimarina sp. AD10]RKN01650.1 T9SS C-terminal target domain-containing protein [Aquimarina sp. AD10]
MKNNNLLLLFCLLLTYVGFAQDYDFVVSQDGAWTWYNDERAAFKNDRLYTSYVKRNGKVALSVNNIKTGATIGSETILSTWTQKDDHNNAAILLRQDEKIMAFYSPHIREKENYYRTSLVNQPSKQSDWSNQISQITTNDSDNKGATYNNAFQLSAENGKIYNFMRTNNFNPNWKEYTANGTPLRNGKDIILFKNGNGSVRPYVKYTSNTINRIDFFFTDGHPRNANNSLYHCYYQTNSNGNQGSIYQTDGTFIATLQSVINGTPIDVSKVNKLYTFGSDGTNARAWTHSINYDTNGRPVVTYSKQININSITYHYARWTGSQWNNYFVSDAGKGLYNGEDDYTGIITSNPYNTNEIFMSSNRNPITGIENNRYEIYSATTVNGGNSWNWTAITTNSPKDNLRPFIPKGITNANDRVALWFYGDYITYENYNTKIVGEFINRNNTNPPSTTITYGVDINTASSATQNGYKKLMATIGSTAIDDGVNFTLFGNTTDSRNRSGAPNNLLSDFAFNNPEINDGMIGVRVSGLPEGSYKINSYHFDQNYPVTVSVTIKEQGGAPIKTVTVSSASPSEFEITAQAGKVYEIIAKEDNISNRTRFNGLSLTKINPVPPSNSPIAKIDIDTDLKNTKPGYTSLIGTPNNSTIINGASYQLFGFSNQPSTTTGGGQILNDFAANTGSVAATPAIGVRIKNLEAGTYTLKSWHYDAAVSSSNVKIQIRDAGFGNPLTTLKTGISLGSTSATTYQITIEAGKDYDLIIRSDQGTESRLNGLELTSSTTSKVTPIKTTFFDDIRIHPNPFTDKVIIQLNPKVIYQKAILFDVTGRKVIEKLIDNKSNSLELNTRTAPGTYLLAVYEKSGTTITKTIIKQ